MSFSTNTGLNDKFQRKFHAAHIREETAFKYAIVLDTAHHSIHKKHEKKNDEVIQQQMDVIRDITDAGLECTVLKATTMSNHKVVLLINSTKERLLHEWKLLQAERTNFKNAVDMRLLERQLEESQGVEFDEYFLERPEWDRDNPQKNRIRSEEELKTIRWEAERSLSYADELACISRIMHGSKEPQIGSEEMYGKVMGANDPSRFRLFRGAGLDHPSSYRSKRNHPIIDNMYVNELLISILLHQSPVLTLLSTILSQSFHPDIYCIYAHTVCLYTTTNLLASFCT